MAVVTDSTAALPAEAAARWGIAVVPLDVVIDGQRYAEGVDLTTQRLVEAVTSGSRVSTSQPAPEAFSQVYARAAARGASAVVSVHLSGEMSGTVSAARSAAERAPLPVHVVDSRTAAGALGFAALAAAWTASAVQDDERAVVPATSGTWLGVEPVEPRHGPLHLPDLRRLTRARPPEGWHVPPLPDAGDLRRLAGRRRPVALPGADEVAAAARDTAAASKVWFLVDSLEHLRRGGRLSAPAAALGTVLGLRPLLTVSGGKVVVAEKIRTRRAARQRLEAVAVAAADAHEQVRLAVHHLGEPDVAADLVARLGEELGPRVREVVVVDAGAVLGAHAGPGLLAVVVTPA